jgi:thioredoxin-like negative regulator of GroEL
MEYFKKIGAVGKKQDSLASSHTEEEKAMDDRAEEDVFEDFNREKDKVEEWWLQKGVEETVEEEAEEEEWEEEKEAEEDEETEDKDDLIYSLKEEDEEEDEMDTVLRDAMEEMGDLNAEELLELCRKALCEMEGEQDDT